MHPLLLQDINEFLTHYRHGEVFAGSTFLITGATGLIGSMLIHCLIGLQHDIRIIAPVRNAGKVKSMFDEEELEYIDLKECDLCSFDYTTIGKVDYVIHCAAPTGSRYFVEHAVETSTFIYNSTNALLQYAITQPVKGFVYLSSLEVYGEITEDKQKLTEEKLGYLNPASPRNSYPIAKLAAENLCSLYARQYNVPVKTARLTQTTGIGVAKDDNRVINQFSRLAARGEDIVLYSSGHSARQYCYTLDAIDAILTILDKGIAGEAYNVGNENTYLSAIQMAEYLRDNFSPTIAVRKETNDNMGYAQETRHNLSTEKLQQLGWQPRYSLNEMFCRLMHWYK